MRTFPRLAALALPFFALTVGCGRQLVSSTSDGSPLSGSIHGGQQPVSGAAIQLYAAGTSGTGSASSALISLAVTSSDGTGLPNSNANAGNANNTLPVGAFQISGDYTCPAPESQVYLLATGGNPGLASGTNNSALRLMVALGSCGQLKSATNIQINELTTVGAVAALAPYITSAVAIGSTSGSAPALAEEFDVANEYVNFVTGSAPGAALPSNYYASTLEINTLADALAACVNTAGNTGSTSNCNMLFQDATPSGGTAPSDTIGALLNIVNNPTNNVGAIYMLAAPQAVFAPTLNVPPTNWALPILPVPATPYFSPVAGTYASAQTVKIATPTNGTSIYFTTDGSTPTTNSTQYTGALTVSASQTLRAIAVNKVSSVVSTGVFTISGAVATPVISLASGAYTSPQPISITEATPDATIYYTTDGTTPTSSSTPYTGPIQLLASETLKAVGISGSSTSSAASASYTYTYAPTSQTIATFAGVGNGLTGAATHQTFEALTGIAVDGSGNVYLSDGVVERAYKVDAASGNLSVVAGNGLCCGAGTEGGQATAYGTQEFNIATDSGGNLYLAALGAGAIYKVTVATGVITRVAGIGSGSNGFSGDNGAATSAQLSTPYGVAVGANGDMVIADTNNNRVRKVTAATGIITTVAGNGTAGYNGDGVAGTTAELSQPKGVAIDANGDVYIADTGNQRIRRVSATTGIITTVAGNGSSGTTTDGVAATATTLSSPRNMVVDATGNLYIADYGHFRVRKVTASSGLINTFAGTGVQGNTGDGGAASSAQIRTPYQLALDPSGDLYFSDSNSGVARRVDVLTGIITTIAGTQSILYEGNGAPAVGAHLAQSIYAPAAVATDTAGNVYFADSTTNTIRKITAGTGIISVVAGTGVAGYTNGNGVATNAQLNSPGPLTIDSNNNLYFMDGNGTYLREITLSNGVNYTIAGGGGSSGATFSGPSNSISLTQISGLATDSSGNVYLADASVNVIRKVTVSTATISTVAGTGTSGNTGDGGAATAATFESPAGLAVDSSGNLYITDEYACVVRKVTTGGVISTVAGNGTCGYTGDGVLAVNAELNNPYGAAVDTSGNLYIADLSNLRVRKVSAATKLISTVAGNGTDGYSGDGGPATQAAFSFAPAIALAPSGNLYIDDTSNNVIRVVYP